MRAQYGQQGGKATEAKAVRATGKKVADPKNCRRRQVAECKAAILRVMSERIRKQVGRGKSETPLQRAFRQRQMLIELRGERPEDDDGDHIRKTVGKPGPKSG